MTSPDADSLTPEAVRAELKARHLGTAVVVRRSAPSTMDMLSDMAQQGAPDGAVVIADFQSAGRGRLARSWVAPAGTALLMSVLLRPHLPPGRIGEVQMAFALAAVEAVDELLPGGGLVGASGRQTGGPSGGVSVGPSSGLTVNPARGANPDMPDNPRAALKWPNDVVVGGDKIAGLLSEAGWRGESARVIIGLGINVHQTPRQLPNGATSLAALGVPPSGAAPLHRARLAADVLGLADAHYDRLLGGESLVEPWAIRLETIGRRVVAASRGGGSTGMNRRVEDTAGRTQLGADPAHGGEGSAQGAPDLVEGTAIGVSPTGALQIRTDGGDVVTVRAGDVTLLPDRSE